MPERIARIASLSCSCHGPLPTSAIGSSPAIRVDHRRQQLVLAGEVGVERGRAGPEAVGHRAHVERVDAALVEDGHRRVDDRVRGQRAARWAPGAHPGRRREVGHGAQTT
jgi:hypothetical protein